MTWRRSKRVSALTSRGRGAVRSNLALTHGLATLNASVLYHHQFPTYLSTTYVCHRNPTTQATCNLLIVRSMNSTVLPRVPCGVYRSGRCATRKDLQAPIPPMELLGMTTIFEDPMTSSCQSVLFVTSNRKHHETWVDIQNQDTISPSPNNLATLIVCGTYTYHSKGYGRDIATTYDRRRRKPCTADFASNRFQVCETISRQPLVRHGRHCSRHGSRSRHVDLLWRRISLDVRTPEQQEEETTPHQLDPQAYYTWQPRTTAQRRASEQTSAS